MSRPMSVLFHLAAVRGLSPRLPNNISTYYSSRRLQGRNDSPPLDSARLLDATRRKPTVSAWGTRRVHAHRII